MDLPPPLDHAIAASLSADWYQETYTRSDGERYSISGLRPLTGQLSGRMAFGPLLIQAGYGLAPSPVQRTDTQELFQRHHHAFEGGLGYRHRVGAWAFSLGPVARYDLYVAYSDPTGRTSDFLDAHFARLGLGVGGRFASHLAWGAWEGGVQYFPVLQGSGVLGWNYGFGADFGYWYPAAGILWGIGYRVQGFGGPEIQQLSNGLQLSIRFSGAR